MGIEFLFAALIIAVAFLGESVFGFGGGLIAIPLLSLLLGVRDAVTLALIFQLCMGLLILRTYKDTDWNSGLQMTPGIILGTIIGTFLLTAISETLLAVILATSIIAFLAKSIFFNGLTLSSYKNSYLSSAIGLVGGLFQGFIGTGGPIITMYLASTTPANVSLRATLIYLFFVTSIIRVAISVSQGLFTPDITKFALFTLPIFLLAIVLGHYLHSKIDGQIYRLGINIILFVSAIALIIKAF